jgi:ubiquinone/menaquinone biosynthesis C-methylase UbiE
MPGSWLEILVIWKFEMDNHDIMQQVESYWDRNVANWKITRQPTGSKEFFTEVERYRFSKLDYLPRRIDYNGYAGKKVLDVGCGLGTDLSCFVAGGAEGTGVDISSTAIELSKKNFDLRNLPAEFLKMDGERMSFADNSFDLVYCHTVLHFTSSPETMVREIYRVLKPGGDAFLMTINRHSWLYTLHKLFKLEIDYMDSPVFRKYTYNEFRQLLMPFDHLELIIERYPTRTDVHSGLKAMIYNNFFVDLYNALPNRLIGKTGYHLLAYAHKLKH